MRRIIEPIFGLLKERLPELNHIDVNLEQLQTDNPPVDFPCALVDVEEVNYRSATGGIQLGEVAVSVTFGFRIFATSDVNSPQELRDLGLQHYDIVRKAAAVLHGFSTPEFTPLNQIGYRRGAQTYPRTITLVFTTQLKDRSVKNYTRIPADPVIIPSIRR